MEVFLFIVVILVVLAVSDLIVGVGNDAVNFLNSAYGSRVAPHHVIMLVASLGIAAGTLFSGGMMEVARKGIFNPEMFYFSEIMTIFLSVMLADVILLDFFNTFGLPTSTTVSIVFELLGAAVVLSLIKIAHSTGDFSQIINYINTSKAIAIIGGILLSIVVAFTLGAIVQFITRLVFTFNYKEKILRYGGVFGGIAITAITFFILLSGLKNAPFISEKSLAWITGNTNFIIVLSFVFWSILFQALVFLKINIFKIVVLVGTFALALAFAANDLVNFIGVPLAGLHSYQIAAQSTDYSELLMGALKGKVESSPWLLILAGLIMIATLYFNKKARTVIKTGVDLSRQSEGAERFESSLLARTIVRVNVNLAQKISHYFPNSFKKFLENRYTNSHVSFTTPDGQKISFDLVRASVNLMVASIIISIATSWKLPLSTTYVTFMVAMGSSFSDKAWGRDSAVYRINGVITVIGGWFFTALIAFTIAGIFATIIYYGELPAMISLALFALFIVYRSHRLHSSRAKEETPVNEQAEISKTSSALSALNSISLQFINFLTYFSSSLNFALTSFAMFDRKEITKSMDELKKIKKDANKIVSEIIVTIRNLSENEVKKGRRYGKIMGATQDISYNYRTLVAQLFDHIENNHRPLIAEQIKSLEELKVAMLAQIKEAINYLENPLSIEEFTTSSSKVIDLIHLLDENQVKMLRDETKEFSTRGNLLYLEMLSISENISSQITHLILVINKNYISLSKDSAQS
jgi:phosphate/sulfate permease